MAPRSDRTTNIRSYWPAGYQLMTPGKACLNGIDLQDLIATGWKSRDIEKIVFIIHGIFRNHRKLSINKNPLNLKFLIECPTDQGAILQFNPKERDVIVYLKPGPTAVLKQAPFLLGFVLAHLLIKADKFDRAGHDYGLFNQAVKDLISFTYHARGLVLDEAKLAAQMHKIVSHYKELMLKFALFDFLLGSTALSRKQIKEVIDFEIVGFRETIRPWAVEAGAANILDEVARFAMYCSLAQKTRIKGVITACKDNFAGELMEDAAAMDIWWFSKFSKKQLDLFLQSADQKLVNAFGGCEIAFNAFRGIFSAYYDSIEIPKRS